MGMLRLSVWIPVKKPCRERMFLGTALSYRSRSRSTYRHKLPLGRIADGEERPEGYGLLDHREHACSISGTRDVVDGSAGTIVSALDQQDGAEAEIRRNRTRAGKPYLALLALERGGKGYRPSELRGNFTVRVERLASGSHPSQRGGYCAWGKERG
jgi:hypothetical protein